jgi:DNA mismatch endonuclease (patch repair protein)
MDIMSAKKRSMLMSKIRATNTKPERILRQALVARKYSMKTHSSDLPGRPDIVLPVFRRVIFVHGCFWHHHTKCRDGRYPESHRSYWRTKLLKTQKRDLTNQARLRRLGWKVTVCWECEIEKNIDQVVGRIAKRILEPSGRQIIHEQER